MGDIEHDSGKADVIFDDKYDPIVLLNIGAIVKRRFCHDRTRRLLSYRWLGCFRSHDWRDGGCYVVRIVLRNIDGEGTASSRFTDKPDLSSEQSREFSA